MPGGQAGISSGKKTPPLILSGNGFRLRIVTGLSATISNTITPNGDGINDYWKITGIELYPKASIMVFNRSGQKIFESVGYGTPFTGTYKGKLLPSGTYYYVIDPHTGCTFRSGSLTIIR